MKNYAFYGTNQSITAINQQTGSVYRIQNLGEGAHIAYDRNIVENTLSLIGKCLAPPAAIVKEQVRRIQDNPFLNMGRRRSLKALPKPIQAAVKSLK